MFRENNNKIPKYKIGALVICGAKLLVQPGKVFDYLEVQLPVEDNLPNVKGKKHRHWGPEWMPMKIKSRIKLSEAKWWRVGNFVLSVNIFTCTNEPIRAQQRWLKLRGVYGFAGEMQTLEAGLRIQAGETCPCPTNHILSSRCFSAPPLFLGFCAFSSSEWVFVNCPASLWTLILSHIF